ncbi:MAG TPA: biotin transporter BioY [Methanocella sp.]|nr:biotin transporter BioY [Methanocella sp.]
MGGKLEDSRVKKLVYASLFSALTAIGAWITIPLPVPLTLQTMFTLLAGAVLGWYFGALSMIVYVLMGLIGLPVFAGGQSGLGVLIGPIGGYLLGFIAGAAVTGLIVKIKKKPGYLWLCTAMVAGTIVIYLFGVSQLAFVMHLPADRALVLGVLPFLPGDVLKIMVGAAIARKIEV